MRHPCYIVLFGALISTALSDTMYDEFWEEPVSSVHPECIQPTDLQDQHELQGRKGENFFYNLVPSKKTLKRRRERAVQEERKQRAAVEPGFNPAQSQQHQDPPAWSTQGWWQDNAAHKHQDPPWSSTPGWVDNAAHLQHQDPAWSSTGWWQDNYTCAGWWRDNAAHAGRWQDSPQDWSQSTAASELVHRPTWVHGGWQCTGWKDLYGPVPVNSEVRGWMEFESGSDTCTDDEPEEELNEAETYRDSHAIGLPLTKVPVSKEHPSWMTTEQFEIARQQQPLKVPVSKWHPSWMTAEQFEIVRQQQLSKATSVQDAASQTSVQDAASQTTPRLSKDDRQEQRKEETLAKLRNIAMQAAPPPEAAAPAQQELSASSSSSAMGGTSKSTRWGRYSPPSSRATPTAPGSEEKCETVKAAILAAPWRNKEETEPSESILERPDSSTSTPLPSRETEPSKSTTVTSTSTPTPAEPTSSSPAAEAVKEEKEEQSSSSKRGWPEEGWPTLSAAVASGAKSVVKLRSGAHAETAIRPLDETAVRTQATGLFFQTGVEKKST